MQARKGPVFTFSLTGGRPPVSYATDPTIQLPLPTVSYATDQVHFKHEHPQVLLIESHVTTGTIQQTQDAASVF